MRKTINRTTVIVVLVLFLCLSVGYALFSDTITIEGTATAKGDFNLETTCTTGMSSDLLDAMGAAEEDLRENGYSNDSCIVSGSTVTMNVDFEYPGSARFFTVQVKNTSSVDVVSEVDSDGFLVVDNLTTNLKVTNTSTSEVTEKTYTGYNYDDYAKEFPIFIDYNGFPPHINIVRLSDGTYLLDDEKYLENEVFYKDSSDKKYIKLSPNETLLLIFVVSWSEDSSMQGYTAETTFNFPIDFKQLSSDMEVDTEADTCLFGC